MDDIERYLLKNKDENFGDGSPRLLRELAYVRLKDAIRYANLQPGAPLSETRISKALGISRTPVREAMQLLAQEGLVEIIPGRAITVASRSIREVLEVIHIRLLLEPELTRLAAESITPDQLATLWNSLKKMEKAVENVDRPAWSKADTVWHEILSEACPNSLLGEMVLQMRNRIHRYANIDHKLEIAQLRNGTAEHRLIVEAIDANDAQLAESHTRTHLENLRANLFNQLVY